MAISGFIQQYWVLFGLRVQQRQCLTPPNTGALVLQSKCIFSTLARSQQMANAFKETISAFIKAEFANKCDWYSVRVTNNQNYMYQPEMEWALLECHRLQSETKQTSMKTTALSNDLPARRDNFIVNSCYSGYSKSSCLSLWLIIFQRFNFKTIDFAILTHLFLPRFEPKSSMDYTDVCAMYVSRYC